MFLPELFLGKKALITGGGSGIGFEIASKFKEFGGIPIIASRKEEKLKHASNLLNCPYYVCDIRDFEQVKTLVQKIKSTCPQCQMPGFGITEARKGLECNLCGSPTSSTLSYIYVCLALKL